MWTIEWKGNQKYLRDARALGMSMIEYGYVPGKYDLATAIIGLSHDIPKGTLILERAKRI